MSAPGYRQRLIKGKKYRFFLTASLSVQIPVSIFFFRSTSIDEHAIFSLKWHSNNEFGLLLKLKVIAKMSGRSNVAK